MIIVGLVCITILKNIMHIQRLLKRLIKQSTLGVKVKVLDVTLNKGDIIYIPAYWFYSISFEKMSSICTFKYRTFMNSLAITPELILSLLQGQNIKRDIAVKMEKEETDNEDNSKIVKNET